MSAADYPCARYGCGERAVRVRVVTVRPNMLAPSVAFYGECDKHAQPLQPGERWLHEIAPR